MSQGGAEGMNRLTKKQLILMLAGMTFLVLILAIF
jgi:hypothetical protein